MKKFFIFLFGMILFSSNVFATCAIKQGSKHANEHLIVGDENFLECDDTDCPDNTIFYSVMEQPISGTILFPKIGKKNASQSVNGYRIFTCHIEWSGDYWEETISQIINICDTEQTQQLCTNNDQAGKIVCKHFPLLPDYNKANTSTQYQFCTTPPCKCPDISDTTLTCAEANLYNQAIQKLQTHLQTLQDKCK